MRTTMCGIMAATMASASTEPYDIPRGRALVHETPVLSAQPIMETLEVEEVAEVPEEIEIVEPEPEVLETEIEPDIGMSVEDIELIALVTMAEAEGECEKGKRLVIDTILNRVDSKRFPNTVKGVIYQPAQFSSMWNGRVNRCYVMEDICQLVREELQSRTNYDVAFFHAGKYGKYGTPLFQVGNHYFSSHE